MKWIIDWHISLVRPLAHAVDSPQLLILFVKVLQVPTRHHLIIRLFIKFTAVLYTEHAYNLIATFFAITVLIFVNSVDLRPFAAD